MAKIMAKIRHLFLMIKNIKWRKLLVFSKSLTLTWCKISLLNTNITSSVYYMSRMEEQTLFLIGNIVSFHVLSFLLMKIPGLLSTYAFVEYRVVNILIDILDDISTRKNLRRDAILTNLQDGLSSILVVYTHLIAAYTGHFSVIIFCTASYVMGLTLFCDAYLSSKVGTSIIVGGMLLIALGNAGIPALEAFADYQLREVVRLRQSTEMNQEPPNAGSREEVNYHVIRVNILLRSARIVGALIAIISPVEEHWSDTFKHAALAMGSSYVLFFSGYIFYALKGPTGTPLIIIIRVFKAALCKLRLGYPVTLERYYWKNDTQDPKLTYSNKIGKVQLLPRVSRLWRWLDKAAIIREPQPPNRSPEGQEMKGGLCTVKEVREVKFFVASLTLLFLTFLPYSMVMAAGNTFFVEQTNNLKENVKITALFLFQSILRDIVLFLTSYMELTKLRVTKWRIGIGMVCAVICCFAAWLVELRRLSLVKEKGVINDEHKEIPMGTAFLVPQFLLLGLMEALVDDGVDQLWDNYVPESMLNFGESFKELVFGIGKLLTIPCAALITAWFKESINTSHIDWYYLTLAILNFVLIFIYAYFSTKYMEDHPEVEELRRDEDREIAEIN